MFIAGEGICLTTLHQYPRRAKAANQRAVDVDEERRPSGLGVDGVEFWLPRTVATKDVAARTVVEKGWPVEPRIEPVQWVEVMTGADGRSGSVSVSNRAASTSSNSSFPKTKAASPPLDGRSFPPSHRSVANFVFNKTLNSTFCASHPLQTSRMGWIATSQKASPFAPPKLLTNASLHSPPLIALQSISFLPRIALRH